MKFFKLVLKRAKNKPVVELITLYLIKNKKSRVTLRVMRLLAKTNSNLADSAKIMFPQYQIHRGFKQGTDTNLEIGHKVGVVLAIIQKG